MPMAKDPRFSNCDAAAVFQAVCQAAMSSDTRSLWDRIQEELKTKQSPGAATEYLRSSFLEIATRLEREIKNVAGEL
jgi:hypothetical protein